VERYHYRQAFGLSSAEMDAEPTDELVTNLLIAKLVAKKQKRNNLRQEQ